MSEIRQSFYEWCIENNRKDLLDRWNYELNNASPSDIAHSSMNKYYFNCDKSSTHKPEYVRLSHITGDGSSVKCKACSSFAQWCIDHISQDFIDKYWHKTLNSRTDPWEIGYGSHKTIWLMCENGFDHYYSTSPHSLTRRGCKCQVCNGMVVFKGFNDLFTTDPDLIFLWDFDKNIDISPYEISRGSGRKVWWKCNICEHEWQASVSNIIKGGRCPLCAKYRQHQTFIDNKFNNGLSFGDCFPQLLDMWDYENNYNIDPFKIFPSSRVIVSWKCQNNHRFKNAIITMRKTFLDGGSLCKYCEGIGVIKGKNDLQTTHPELLLDWDYDKNTDCSPCTIAFGSTKPVWWKCNICGNGWIATPNSRTNLNSGCPECARHFSISKLQKMVEKYIAENYNYENLHERNCSIIAVNPKTGYKLPYDNDVKINEDRLIIEVNGEQHYHICQFTITNAAQRGVTPQEEFEYQQYKDKIKKEYALSKGYYYLEIPYTATRRNEYQQLIDKKICEILTIQN